MPNFGRNRVEECHCFPIYIEQILMMYGADMPHRKDKFEVKCIFVIVTLFCYLPRAKLNICDKVLTKMCLHDRIHMRELLNESDKMRQFG